MFGKFGLAGAARAGLVVAVCAAALMVAACGSDEASSAGGAGKGGGTLQIPFMGPYSGPSKQVGESMQHGVDQAIKEINAEGGLLGQKLEAVYRDDAGVPASSVSQARAVLADLDPPVFFGAALTGNSDAIQPLMNQARIINFPGSSNSKGIDAKKYPYAFRGYITEVSYDTSLVRYMQAHNLKSASLVMPSVTTLPLVEDLTPRIKEAGLTLKSVEKYNVGNPDFTPLALQIKKQDPDVVTFSAVAVGDAANYVKAAKTVGVRGLFIGQPGVSSSKFEALAGEAGKDAIGQVLNNLTYTEEGGPTHPPMVDFIREIKAAGGQDDLFLVDAYWYDMVKLWATAVKKANSTEPDKVKTALESITNYQGLQGPMSFSPTQHDGLSPDSIAYAVIGEGTNEDGLWLEAEKG
jgi:branched-chain amino acid transport system substrate-binding protein